ncbi:hypothetical protein [Clostridium scatologenes]|uniref:Uncharacterized protein n=1 Tax=Clostridium scatologenes TaxID=1548 RepID=A0A0E3M6Y7_CLOSL|nr:hypothetical protein [Clostridium scatologenes]AKA70159.1 hypothetical protein CSCA_3034 [Clostridium scatologenes]
MKSRGTYTEYPDINKVEFKSNNGSSIIVDCQYINGQAAMSIENTEKVARWAINNGNKLGYNLMEQVNKVKIIYNF